MSELTLCNYCRLKSIRARAQEGTRTYVRKGTGDWYGWTVVTQSGKSEPVAYFMELTSRCAC